MQSGSGSRFSKIVKAEIGRAVAALNVKSVGRTTDARV